MKKEEEKRARRRFCEAVDGPEIRRRYAHEPTEDIARDMGLTVRQFLYVYPNLEASLKDKKDAQGNIIEVAKIENFTLAGAKSRLGATVSKKYSSQFAADVSWQRVDASGAAVEEEDITDGGTDTPGGDTPGGGDNPGGGGGDDVIS